MYPTRPIRFVSPLHTGWWGVFLLLGLVVPAPLDARQTAIVRTEENLRAEPNGQVVGRVLPGTRLAVEGRRDRWLQVTLEGWVWLPSLQRRSGGAFDLSVSAEDGENLRDEPRGRIAARLGRGTLLNEVAGERVTGWARVRRTAWIWAPSVEVSEPAPPPTPAAAAAPAVPPSRWIRGGVGGSPILSGPDGDTLARSRPGAEMRVMGREGNWVRVQLEGWVWAPDTAAAADGGLSDASPEQVVAEPERFRGRVVSWPLQFIALERAERVRTDFFAGEPYLLTRAPGVGAAGEGVFVYVTIPPERVDEVRGLTPLERITITGRIRTGSAGLTGSPIVDLLELRRGGR